MVFGEDQAGGVKEAPVMLMSAFSSFALLVLQGKVPQILHRVWVMPV